MSGGEWLLVLLVVWWVMDEVRAAINRNTNALNRIHERLGRLPHNGNDS